MRKTSILILAIALLLPSMIYTSYDVGATSWYWSYYPSAKNSTLFKALPFPQVNYGNQSTITVAGDSPSLDIYSSFDGMFYVQTGDYTNDTYVIGYPITADYVSHSMPPDNGTATIITVVIYALFRTISPDMYILFTTNNGASWYNSSPILSGFGPQAWNVTSTITWNATILNSPDLLCRVNMAAVHETHYYLDYIGFLVHWSVPYAGGFVPPSGGSSEDTGMHWAMTSGSIMGLFGIFSFCGMIAIPALAVWSYRQGAQPKARTIMVAFISFVFCAALFLAYINS